jgi:hypothetical protein
MGKYDLKTLAEHPQYAAMDRLRRWIGDTLEKRALREIGPRLHRVVAAYYPDALAADPTALEARAGPDGSVFVISD